ncbi:extracellular solute-binding protein [Paenibacillus albus]|uniref:extracellular solute-binding protein n=1 Tax=Paenibacillus albus TaxID=2495582 RepID=UPI0013DE84AB|nr:extracellular solute-binding protein [Paenibacillus albus]
MKELLGWKKGLSVLAVASLTALTIAGCSNSNSNSNSNSSEGNSAAAASNANSKSNTTDAAANNSKSTDGETANEPLKQVKLSLLTNWNGWNSAPPDEENNPIAKVIREKTGVTLDIIPVNQNEVEKINTMFATQDLPDIYIGAPWVGGAEMEAFYKAGNEGQLTDLTPYLDKFPNITKYMAKDKVPAGFYNRYIDPSNFGGKSYFLISTPMTPQDSTDWLYSSYIRKDIAAKVGIDPQSVHTPDDYYNLLKKIKDLGLKENGKDIIPAGGFHGGWAVDYMANRFFLDTGDGGWMTDKDGNVKYGFMTQNQTDEVLYMRKLISEGLIDPEAFLQSEAIANEKVSQGRYAVLTAHFNSIYDATRSFVKDHPDAEFVPVGPFNDRDGNPNRAVFNQGTSNVIAFPKSNKDIEASLRLIDYLYSDEGNLLVKYGIEGQTYTMKDGKPVAIPDVLKKKQEDPNYALSLGLDAGYNALTGPDRTFSLFGGPLGHEADPKSKLQEEYTKILRPQGVQMVTTIDPGSVVRTDPKWESNFKPIVDNQQSVIQQAYYAKSDDEAIKILDQVRAQLEKAGIHDIEKMLTEKNKETPMTFYITGN